MTPEEVRQKLGLKTWEEHRLYVYLYSLPDRVKTLGFERTAKELDRQTGRTTKMIIEALSAMSCGQSVYFVAYNQDMTKFIYKRAAEYAEKLGISTDLLVKKGNKSFPQPFVDHVALGIL